MIKIWTKRQLEEIARDYGSVPMLIKFCNESQVCRRYDQVIKEAEAKYDGRVLFVEADVDLCEYELLDEFHLPTVPATFILINGMIARRVFRALDKEEVSSLIERYL